MNMNNKKKINYPLMLGKRLMVFFLGVVLSVTLIAVGLLIFLDDDDYRDALIWASHQYLDSKLEIGAPFAIRLGKETSVDAGQVRLTANDGSYSLAVGELNTRIQLDQLLNRTLWINSLMLANVELEVVEGKEPRDLSLMDITIPPLVIAEARLQNLNLTYTQQPPGKVHTVTLHELEIDDINNTGPVYIKGKGLLEGREFAVTGQVTPLAEVIKSGQPYPLQLSFSSGTLDSELTGTIKDPLRGRGLDLQLALRDPQLSETLRLFDENAPAAGAVDAHARIRGDYAAPRLEDIHIHLQRGEDADLTIEGEIDNILARERMRFDFSGYSRDPRLLSWFLFQEESELENIKGKGRVIIEPDRYRIENLDTQGISHDAFAMHITGNAEFPAAMDSKTKPVSDMKMRFSAPTTTALEYLGLGSLPDLGAVQGTAGFVPSMQGVALRNIRMEAGKQDYLYATARGTIGNIPWSAKISTSGFDLSVEITSARSAYLDAIFGFEFPELGPVSARTHVTGSMDSLSLKEFKVDVGAPDQPTIRASGKVATRLRKHTSTMDVEFDVATADLIAAFTKVPRGYLGRLRGNVSVSDVDGSWGLDQFQVASSQTTLFRLEIAGALDDLVKRDQGKITSRIEIEDPAAFGKALDIDLSGFSPYHETGLLTIADKRLKYQSRETLGATTAHTNLTGSLQGDRPFLEGKIEIPVLYLEDIGISPKKAPAPTGERAGKQPVKSTAATIRAPLFSREPLRLGWLHLLDLDIAYDIADVKGTGMSFRQLQARVRLADGVLRVAPAKLVFEGGPSTLELELDARKVPAFTLKAKGDDLTLGPALGQVQDKVPVDGYVNLQIDLNGSGRSAHEIASSLGGTAGFALENARIPGAYVEYLSVDVFGWALRTATGREEYAKINCTMGEFEISEGVITSKLLVLDGPHLSMKGNMTVNLGEETIDMVLLPRKKKRVFSRVSPVHIKGSLRDPDVSAIPVKSAVTSIGPLVLIPTIAIPTIVAGKLWESVDDKDKYGGGCSALVEEAQKAGK